MMGGGLLFLAVGLTAPGVGTGGRIVGAAVAAGVAVGVAGASGAFAVGFSAAASIVGAEPGAVLFTGSVTALLRLAVSGAGKLMALSGAAVAAAMMQTQQPIKNKTALQKRNRMCVTVISFNGTLGE